MVDAPVAAITTSVRPAPPRVKFSSEELVREVLQSNEWDHVLQEARHIGMEGNGAVQALELLVASIVNRDDVLEIPSKELKRILEKCGLSPTDAKRKICTALDAVRSIEGIDPRDNQFFRVPPNGRLDISHLSNVVIKQAGVTECLQSGTDSLSVRIRAFVSHLVRLAIEQVNKAHRFLAAHKAEEADRLRSVHVLKQTFMEVDGCSERGAQSILRNFAKKNDALRIVDKSMPGFSTASQALVSVASTQLTRRANDAVSDNLTTVGKDADRYMNSAVTNDILRVRPQIDAATSRTEKKRLRLRAMNERVDRLKQFNMFAEDPAMVGMETAEISVRDQANFYLNQDAEKANFD